MKNLNQNEKTAIRIIFDAVVGIPVFTVIVMFSFLGLSALVHFFTPSPIKEFAIMPLIVFLLFLFVFIYLTIDELIKKGKFNQFKPTVKFFGFVIGMLSVVAILATTFYFLNPYSYPHWPVEKKQAYQFMLLERKLISSPEKLGKVCVVIQKKNWKSDFDTLSPTEAKKLISFPTLYSVKITVPFKEFGEDCQLSLVNYKGKIGARIIRPYIVTETIYEWWGVAEIQHRIGKQEYPYAQGKRENGNFIFKNIPDKEFEQLTLEALEKGNHILKET